MKIYIQRVVIIVIAIIIIFREERIERKEFLGPIFLAHCWDFWHRYAPWKRMHLFCIYSKIGASNHVPQISLRYVQNMQTYCWSGKYNLIQSKTFIMSLQLLFNLQVLDWESDFQKFFQQNNCHTEIFVHNIGCPSNRCFVHVWCTIQT